MAVAPATPECARGIPYNTGNLRESFAMAIRLLVVLLALGLLHVAPQLARWRHDRWFRRWSAQLADTAGVGRVVLALALPLLLFVLVWWLCGHGLLGDVLQTLLALVVLMYSLGPRELDTDLDAIRLAADDASREKAAQALGDQGEAIAWNAFELREALAWAALRRRFGVLLWFFLLGPFGALLYRLAQSLARIGSLRLDTDSRRAAQHIANALDWPAAQLLTFTLALVGHWEAVIGAWRQWHGQASPTSWYSAEPGFLAAAARTDVQVETEAGDGYAEDHSDPLLELTRLSAALSRALLAWLGAAALIAIGGWLG